MEDHDLTCAVAPHSGRGADGGPEVSVADTTDVGAILRLIEEAGWAYTRSEVERLIEVQPKGMLLIRSRGLRRDVRGCVYASAWGHLGFIGLMLVKASHRGRGLGRHLMDHALAQLREEGCTAVGLDAVPDAIGFYGRLGFKSRWESLRMTVDTSHGAVPKEFGQARVAREGDLPGIYDLDRRFSGIDRTNLLERLASAEDCVTFVVRDGELVQAFGVLRRSKGCLRLGPLMAVPDGRGSSGARSILLLAIAETYPRMLTVNIPAYNQEAREVVEALGAVHHPPCMRMYMGEPGPARAPQGVWALGAAEKG